MKKANVTAAIILLEKTHQISHTSKYQPDKRSITARYIMHPPFRAEHLGSLLRPDSLLKARIQFEKGEITQEDLTPLEDEAVNKVVQMQLDIDMRPISDGEYR